MNNIILIVLFVIGVIIAYCLGRSHPNQHIGEIIISDSDDPQLDGKVQFIFNENIEDLIMHRSVTLQVKNELTKKYNHDNEETK